MIVKRRLRQYNLAMEKKGVDWLGWAGVVILMLALPSLLKGINYLQRLMSGVDGRLASISVDTQRPVGPMTTPTGEVLGLFSQLGSTRLAVSGEGTWVKAYAASKPESVGVLVINKDSKDKHEETVPINFLNIKNNGFVLKETSSNGKSVQEEIATTEGYFQREVFLAPNSAVLLELTPKL